VALTPASKKAKGRIFQQWVRDKLLAAFDERGVRAEDIRSTSMGASGEDLQFSPFARDLIGISVECKSHKSFAIYNIYDQCVTNAKGNEPVVFIKANLKKPLAIVDAEHYISLLKLSKEKET
jgi:hypothetical protein